MPGPSAVEAREQVANKEWQLVDDLCPAYRDGCVGAPYEEMGGTKRLVDVAERAT
jgi:hypothetical protein